MSRIGKQAVKLPSGVTAEVKSENFVAIKGSKGELIKQFPALIKIEVKENEIIASRLDDLQQTRAIHGLVRSLLANMVEGVSKGYERKLEIVGVGYRATTAKNKITLTLGYSHPVEYIAPKDIEFSMDPELKNIIIIKGIDKQTLGEVAAKIRSFRKPEPYKGKGIKYFGEHIRRKAGKAAGAKQ
ncbi:50S ribosomal protein L6 [Candidatus Peregrinibacteria bacterium]|nr:50S ribosomal protein L6 [Candidatus Peregrinibacteria bacterium]